MWLAPGPLDLWTALWTTAGVALIVSSANAMNCWLERDVDRLMERTADRPLPAGRLDARTALRFGVGLSLLGLPVLAFAVNALTACLGAIAVVVYVGVYTPLKQRSWLALLVGAIPGAMPPLLGWTAATGRVEVPGLVLFLILFLWQLPHFIAIAEFRKGEYENAGLRVLPSERSERVARVHAVFWAAVLLPLSLLPTWLGLAGSVYLAVAAVLGAVYLAVAGLGLRFQGRGWARRLFVTSIVYLPVLFAALVIDAR
jgi:protoheme IX farnesyltransferase